MIGLLPYLAGSHTDLSTCLIQKGAPYSAVLIELHLLVTHLGLQSPTYCGVRVLICSARITTDSDFNRLWALCISDFVALVSRHSLARSPSNFTHSPGTLLSIPISVFRQIESLTLA